MSDIFRDPVREIPRDSPLYRLYGHLWGLGIPVVGIIAIVCTIRFAPRWNDWEFLPVMLVFGLMYAGILKFLVHPWFVRIANRYW